MVTNQKCVGCSKKGQVKLRYEDRIYCNDCFEKLIEKRVRKDIRLEGKIKPGGSIELLNDNSKEYKTAKVFIKRIFGEHLSIKDVKIIGRKTIIPTNQDREIKKKLEHYLNNRKESKRNTILHNVLEDEIIAFCKINKIKVGKAEIKNELIEGIEKIYPGTKFALAKSLKKIFP